MKLTCIGILFFATCFAAMAEAPSALAATIRERGEVLQAIGETLERQAATNSRDNAYVDLQNARIALLCLQRDTISASSEKKAVQGKIVDTFENILKASEQRYAMGVATNLDVLRSKPTSSPLGRPFRK